MSAGFELLLSGGVDAPGAARRAIEENHPTLPQSVQNDVSLLVTEFVTMPCAMGGAADDRPLQLEFRRRQERIRVEVVDPGTDFDSPARPGNGDSGGGWGLFLVDRIAERWGVCPAPSGTCVWFEVPAGVTA